MQDTIYTPANRIFDGAGQLAKPGQDVNLPKGLQLPHVPVDDTELAACLGALGFPFRTPGPYTHDVALTETGNERRQRKVWWLADRSATQQDGKGQPITTDFVIVAWANRVKFEAENPLHPLVAMRAAIDARSSWVLTVKAWRAGRARLPIEPPTRAHYVTDSIHGASVLKACGFEPLAFNGRAFFLTATHGGMHAEQILTEASRDGGTPHHWMATALFNLGHLLKLVKSANIILNEPHADNQSLLLTTDSTAKTRDKFYRRIA